MAEYPSNSDKSKVKADLTEKKKGNRPDEKEKPSASVEEGGVSKFFRSFIADDVGNIKDYIIYDVVIPDIKVAMEEILHMALHGGQSRGRSRSARGRTRYTSYDTRSRSARGHKESREREEVDEGRRRTSKVTRVRCDDRYIADEILVNLEDYVFEYELVTVAKMCEFANMETLSTDGRYGWTSNAINKVEKRLINGDWYLIFPKPLPIDD